MLFLAALTNLLVAAVPAPLQGSPCSGVVDANLWTAETYRVLRSTQPDGNWQITPEGSSVAQTAFGQPTFLISDFELDGTAFECAIRTNPTGVGGAVLGLALGIVPGETADPAADYILIDWRRSNDSKNWDGPSSCTPATTRLRGLAAARVSGRPTGDELWGHVNFDVACSDLSNGVVELARGSSLGSAEWRFHTTYLFRVEYTSQRIRVFVDGNLEFDLAGSFPAGGVGFYTFNQGNIAFSAFLTTRIAVAETYGNGTPGANGLPLITLSAPPAYGTSVAMQLTSSANSPQKAAVVIGFHRTDVMASFGAQLLVRAPYAAKYPYLALPVGASQLSLQIPPDPALCGARAYAQLLQRDPGAASGYASSRGLEMRIGE